MAALAACLMLPAPAPAQVFLTVDEALALAFPDCRVERTTVYLTEEQLARARRLAGGAVESALVHPYVARCPDGEDGGVAYFDSHRVRTLPETLMVVVGPEDEVARIEVLSFKEPPDYIPRQAWYDQFLGRELDAELELKRGIRSVTGATLTARATTDAVRRVLAVHRVVRTAGALDRGTPEAEARP
ncbi:MAG TPA: FMN-binding protein [Thermoanaerobaculia bacterium]|nr:FMN-binding protein [Thermoanaerobaculia bacterium]